MTFPTGVDLRKYSDEELTTMLAEAGEASKHARKRGRVMGIVAAHRLEQMKDFLLYNELAIWRRENGFDRVEAVEKNRLGDHRSLPPTPEQYYASLWAEVVSPEPGVPIRTDPSSNRLVSFHICLFCTFFCHFFLVGLNVFWFSSRSRSLQG